MYHVPALVMTHDLARDEPARINELHALRILDTPAEAAFDDITWLAANYFETPIAIVSLVDKDRVWFKSAQGLGDIRQIGRGPGLCAAAIMRDECYVASDLREDPNSAANALVANANGFRFYAAAPLKTRNGYNIGTFCLIDYKPRHFSDADANDLWRFGKLALAQFDHMLAVRELAQQAGAIIGQGGHLPHPVNRDAVTGLHNWTAARALFDEVQRDTDNGLSSTVVVFDIDHFKAINDAHGHQTSEFVITEVARMLNTMVRASDLVMRFGDNGFLLVLRRCPPGVAQDISLRIRIAIRQMPVIVDGGRLVISLSGGLCHSKYHSKVDEMIRSACAALHAAKNGGRDRIVMS